MEHTNIAQELCIHGCNQPGIYFNKNIGHWQCAKSSNSCPAVKQRQRESIKKILPYDGEALCIYGCGQRAKWLLTKRELPCCSQHFTQCPSNKKKLRDSLFNSEPYDGEALCIYGCGQRAKWLRTATNEPCCSKNYTQCPQLGKLKIIRYTAIKTDELCQYGCNTQAHFITSEGRYCCSENHASCRGIREAEPQVNSDANKLCSFGCGNVAKFKFASGNYCCAKNVASCPGQIQLRRFRAIQTEKLCDFNCGNVAKYANDLGQYCCESSVAACPSIQKKTKIARSWMLPKRATSDLKCRYCGNSAYWLIYDPGKGVRYPCCKEQSKFCPANQLQIRPIKRQIIPSQPYTYKHSQRVETNEICKYGCGRQAKWLLHGKHYSCSASPTGCPQIQAKFKQTMLSRYGVEHALQNKEIWIKQQQSGYRRRDYKLPSGRVIQLQGYEPEALTYLLKRYNETDFDFDAIPIISYNQGANRYFPDLYVPKEKLMIEVKSQETYERYYERNVAKALGTLQAGYRMLFVIVLDEIQELEVTQEWCAQLDSNQRPTP